MAPLNREVDREGIHNMWTVVYMAQNKEVAEKLKSILEEGGILVKLSPINHKEKADDYFEVSVPESEVEEAHGIIIERGF
jgi:hypothetical protein